MKNFSCPMGLTNKDAMCVECKEAKPVKVEGSTCGGPAGISGFWLKFPDGKSSSIIPASEETIESKYSELTDGFGTCTEWNKKKVAFCCGCGGVIRCICGYSTMFCLCAIQTEPWKSAHGKCPFCGRSCTIIHAKGFARSNFDATRCVSP